ncbi:MAG: redox-regulated ATPase YchF [Patescibacteria group bacterium]|nr:redox-regulated ATPase YchF [Patescibacteria group bacterium]
MSLSIGILGLPNVGKSTLFQALTKKKVDISNYPFCTVQPNVGVVEVPDERLAKLAQIQKSKKQVPAIIKFVDIAGLVKGAHKGEGLGNQFLSYVRETDALLEIVRCFKNENVAHLTGTINPQKDIDIVKTELILKDLETIEKRLQKIEKEAKQGKKEAIREKENLNFLKEKLQKGQLASLDQEENLFLLTSKPKIYLLNCFQEEIPEDLKEEFEKINIPWLQLDLREELDKSELGEDERKELALENSGLENLIKKCYKILNLITFFTIAGVEETRAWPIKKGSTVLEGAGKIHSDFREKFIRAEVLNWQKVVEIGGWKKAREKGLLKTAGKDYILEEGDVVEIKHN